MPLACVASVFARVRRENWARAKKGMKGEGREGNARGVFQDRGVRGQAFPSLLSPLHSFFCSRLIFSTNFARKLLLPLFRPSWTHASWTGLAHLSSISCSAAWIWYLHVQLKLQNAVFFLLAAFSLSINCWFRSFQAHLFAVYVDASFRSLP